MKFSCEKETLLNLLNIASRAVTGKSSMPLLEGLLLAADADTLTITGYDLSMGIRTTAQVDVVEPGRIVLNSRLFCEIVRKLPQDVVYLETDDKLMTTIKCGRSVFNLMASEADEYPALADVASDKGLSLPQPILKSMIAQTIFSVSDNESKPIHTGCLFEIEGNRLNVVAVDGYRLSVRRETVEGVPGDMKVVVPGASLREIERILGDDDDIVEIFPDSKNILFRIGGTTLITRLIDGEFLNYRAAIPKEFEHEVSADRQELIQCIERVSLIVSEKLKNPIRFHFDGSYVQMSCVTAIGKSYDECPFDGSIENLEIGFNNRYILEALLNTLIIAVVSAFASTVLGTMAAVGINRMKRMQKKVMMNITNFPMVNPEIVTGVSMMLLFVAAVSLFGGKSHGMASLIIAHITFCLPYVILSVLPKLRQMNPNLFEAAQDLGCPPVRAFFKVVLPEIMPGIVTGMIMAFTLSIDDFVISYFTSGTTQTLPIYIYSMTRKRISPEINALSTVLFVCIMLLLIIINVRQGREERRAKKAERERA